jgi:hypothetical protein
MQSLSLRLVKVNRHPHQALTASYVYTSEQCIHIRRLLSIVMKNDRRSQFLVSVIFRDFDGTVHLQLHIVLRERKMFMYIFVRVSATWITYL